MIDVPLDEIYQYLYLLEVHSLELVLTECFMYLDEDGTKRYPMHIQELVEYIGRGGQEPSKIFDT